MDADKRFELIKRNTEEILTDEDLKVLLESGEKLKHYIGFEISGKPHLGHGLVCMSKVKDFVDAGVDVTIFLADYHSWINNKLGGDMNKLIIAGNYFINCFKALGLSEDKVSFRWSHELVDHTEYWTMVIKIAKSLSLHDTMKALPIMGRSSNDKKLEMAWLFYPVMQAADIFELDVNLSFGGMDQRKIHMLAREVAPKIGKNKPIILHTPLISGLKGKGVKMDGEDQPDLVEFQNKMSKSNPSSCIFIHDTPEQIQDKIRNTFCSKDVIEGNPILEICKYIIFYDENAKFEVKRLPKFGGTIKYEKYIDVEQDLLSGKLDPFPLKMAVAEVLSNILAPVRDYFQKCPESLEQMELMLNA